MEDCSGHGASTRQCHSSGLMAACSDLAQVGQPTGARIPSQTYKVDVLNVDLRSKTFSESSPERTRTDRNRPKSIKTTSGSTSYRVKCGFLIFPKMMRSQRSPWPDSLGRTPMQCNAKDSQFEIYLCVTRTRSCTARNFKSMAGSIGFRSCTFRTYTMQPKSGYRWWFSDSLFNQQLTCPLGCHPPRG